MKKPTAVCKQLWVCSDIPFSGLALVVAAHHTQEPPEAGMTPPWGQRRRWRLTATRPQVS